MWLLQLHPEAVCSPVSAASPAVRPWGLGAPLRLKAHTEDRSGWCPPAAVASHGVVSPARPQAWCLVSVIRQYHILLSVTSGCFRVLAAQCGTEGPSYTVLWGSVSFGRVTRKATTAPPKGPALTGATTSPGIVPEALKTGPRFLL